MSKKLIKTGVEVLFVSLLLLSSISLAQAGFTDVTSWESYSPKGDALGNAESGYYGATFDGRYVYFPPERDSGGRHGEFMRYDTQGAFDSVSSWEAYDYGADVANADLDGYREAAFDGRYVYFAPYRNNSAYHGNILRFDTEGTFADQNAWELFNAPVELSNANLIGYHAPVFDGRYMYFIPHGDSGVSTSHGLLLRYDTTLSFSSTGSWSVKDIEPLGDDTYGFRGASFDGQYLYLNPYYGNQEFVRYDTTADFSLNGSYEVHETSFSLGGYLGYSFFDGRYVYYAPYRNVSPNTYHGIMVRYDTQGSFTSNTSWEDYDPGADGLDAQDSIDADGFGGLVASGTEIVYFPFNNGTEENGVFLKNDPAVGFDTLSAWSSFDVDDNSVTSTNLGFRGGVLVDGAMIFSAYNEDDGIFVKYTFSPEYPATLTSTSVSASSEYSIELAPVAPLATGSQVVFTFPDSFDLSADGIDAADVSLTGAGISSAPATVDAANGRITFDLTTTSSVVSYLTFTLGEAAADDLTNPAIPGVYGIGVDVYDADGEPIQQGIAYAEIDTNVTLTAIITEALIMTLTNSGGGTGITLQVDPAVNDGQDLSESTTLAVSTNARNGYVIKAELDDGSGNARLVNADGDPILSNVAAGDNYFSYTARNDGTGSPTVAEQDFSQDPSNLLDDSSDTIGLGTVTDSQSHTVNYDLNVNFLTPAGVYTGTVYYTVVAAF